MSSLFHSLRDRYFVTNAVAHAFAAACLLATLYVLTEGLIW